MQKIRMILQMKLRGLSDRKIAKATGISRNTVSGYLQRIGGVEIDYEQFLQLSDTELAELTFSPTESQTPADLRKVTLWERLENISAELGKTGVTRLILWQEYMRDHADGYSYTQFCEHLNLYLKKKNVVMHFEHKAGEVMMIDFAGDKLSYVDRESGELTRCEVLVCVLPHSGFTYVVALPSQQQEDFCGGIADALRFFGGVPRSILCDNLKSGIIRSDRYEPKINALLEQLSLHYGTTVMATRPGKPRDKASVEGAVLNAYRRIYAPLRHREFDSLPSLNAGIAEQLEVLNTTAFKGKNYSRMDVFMQREKETLAALPSTAFEIKKTTLVKVLMNYHVCLGEDKHFYSVPFEYTGKQAVVHYTASSVEVYVDHKRIASHKRIRKAHQYTTWKEHMPEEHSRYQDTRGWDADYFLEKAHIIGPFTHAAVTQILQSRIFVQQAFNSCKGILRLAKQYGNERLEQACKIAQSAPSITYRFLDNILKNRTDLQPPKKQQPDLFTDHENLRGPGYYQ